MLRSLSNAFLGELADGFQYSVWTSDSTNLNITLEEEYLDEERSWRYAVSPRNMFQLLFNMKMIGISDRAGPSEGAIHTWLYHNICCYRFSSETNICDQTELSIDVSKGPRESTAMHKSSIKIS